MKWRVAKMLTPLLLKKIPKDIIALPWPADPATNSSPATTKSKISVPTAVSALIKVSSSNSNNSYSLTRDTKYCTDSSRTLFEQD